MASITHLPQALWDSRQLSEHLNNIPLATLDQWAYKKIGPAYVRVGRHRRYRPEDVQAWEIANRRGGDAA